MYSVKINILVYSSRIEIHYEFSDHFGLTSKVLHTLS